MIHLHSAAGLHGHEFSAARSKNNSPSPRKSPLVRSAFSQPAPRLSPTYDSPQSNYARAARALSAGSTAEHLSVAEVDFDTMSDDGKSYATSESSETTAGGGRRKRRQAPHASTSFHLAHPAPTGLARKQRIVYIRPKLLLQLQRLSAGSRPTPTLDVLPGTVFVPRLAKRFPGTKFFRGKAELGVNDVMVVHSEDYNAPDTAIEDDSEEGVAENRDVVAVICQMRKEAGGSQGMAEICMSDGSVWAAKPMPNGNYEFSWSNGINTKIARWVRRPISRVDGDMRDPHASDTNNPIRHKYLFSIIDPDSRRHPTMATLTQNTLDISDTFTTVSASASRFPPTSPVRRAAQGDERESDKVEQAEPKERVTRAVDDNTKILIQITAIWVSLREGWSPYFKYNDSMSCNGALSSPTGASAGRSNQRNSTPESAQSSFSAKVGLLGNLLSRGSPSSAPSSPIDRIPSSNQPASSGPAFMKRAAVQRPGNPADSEGEMIPSPPQRAATAPEKNGSPNTRTSSSPLAIYLHSGAVPETHIESIRYARKLDKHPSSPLQFGGVQDGRADGYEAANARMSAMPRQGDHVEEERPKVGRWKALCSMFRREDNSSD